MVCDSLAIRTVAMALPAHRRSRNAAAHEQCGGRASCPRKVVGLAPRSNEAHLGGDRRYFSNAAIPRTRIAMVSSQTTHIPIIIAVPPPPIIIGHPCHAVLPCIIV